MSDESRNVEDYADWLKKRHASPRRENQPTFYLLGYDEEEYSKMRELEKAFRAYTLGLNEITDEQFPRLPRSLDERVSDLEKKSEKLEQRVSQIEQSNKRSFVERSWFEIVSDITRIFSSTRSLLQVYCEKTEHGCDLIFIHNSKDKVAIQEEILKKTLDLEEKYPMLYFDYLILHTEEAVQADLASKILVFDKTLTN